ncbi:hypothetical protein L873DRAFT_1807851 [Choiromyces venosus 120613-1]|uniref:Uncharacterized protein n=1 Tax=Choiromyces venosus 120613-1 TaxID=1336337 RepID=A0A3N4JPN7_9PEZI|nr:hypothetical protein L873DRAFT_1807851 [Choiromyces venosus 120613-1]
MPFHRARADYISTILYQERLRSTAKLYSSVPPRPPFSPLGAYGRMALAVEAQPPDISYNTTTTAGAGGKVIIAEERGGQDLG